MSFLKRIFAPPKPPVKFDTDPLSVDILARTIYGEARNQIRSGMEAIASVVLNRVEIAQRHDGHYWWGSNIIDVCRKPQQFSCWNQNDPNYDIIKKVTPEDGIFAQCITIAKSAVSGTLTNRVYGATHYHVKGLSPYWAVHKKPVCTIGDHVFYNLEGA